MSADEEQMKRIFGAFYGQLVGDALGSRYEFLASAKVKKMIEEDMIDGKLPLLGNKGLYLVALIVCWYSRESLERNRDKLQTIVKWR